MNLIFLLLIAFVVFSNPEMTYEVKPEPPKPVEVVPVESKPTAGEIVDAISKFETNRGKAGVGASRNNPCAIKCSGIYCSYPTLEAGYKAAVDLWVKSYSRYPLDSALARWKTGDPRNRDPSTLKYIQNIKSELHIH